MNNNINIIYIVYGIFIIIISSFFIKDIYNYKNTYVNEITGSIISLDNNKMVIKDNDDVIYTFNENVSAKVGDSISINCIGEMNRNMSLQKCDVKYIDNIEVSD